MPRAWFLLLILLFVFPPIFAQGWSGDDTEESPAIPVDPDWYDDYNISIYSRGDRTFSMTLGIIFPTVFSNIPNNDHGLSTVGGTGALSFNYFLTSNIFVGGEISGKFSFTRQGNSLFIIPMGARIGYQFVYRRFEFPVSLMVGFADESNFIRTFKSVSGVTPQSYRINK